MFTDKNGKFLAKEYLMYMLELKIVKMQILSFGKDEFHLIYENRCMGTRKPKSPSYLVLVL